MVELGYAIGGEELGTQPCDGLICATPTGSTAYNLSNGGPVLVWGLDAMVLTFVAPHALVHPPARRAARARRDDHEPHARARRDRARRRPAGRRARARRAGASCGVGSQHSLLATLPEVTFFRRYAATFGRD